MRHELATNAQVSSSPFILILLKLFNRLFFICCLRLTWLCTFFSNCLWLHFFICLIRWSLSLISWTLIWLWISRRFCLSIIRFLLFILVSFYLWLSCLYLVFLLSSIVFFSILIAINLVNFCSYGFSSFSSSRVQRLIWSAILVQLNRFRMRVPWRRLSNKI